MHPDTDPALATIEFTVCKLSCQHIGISCENVFSLNLEAGVYLDFLTRGYGRSVRGGGDRTDRPIRFCECATVAGIWNEGG